MSTLIPMPNSGHTFLRPLRKRDSVFSGWGRFVTALAAGRGRFIVVLGMAPAALLAAGCQPSINNATSIPPLPPLEQTQGPAYVVNTVLAAPSSQVDAGRDETDPITKIKAPTFGKATYEADCQSCHGIAGKPTRPGIPDLSDPVFTWTKTPQEFYKDMYEPAATDAAHWGHSNVLKAVIRSTSENKNLAASATPPQQSLWNAVFYCWTFHSTPQALVQGGLTFGRYCSVCHGTKGLGDGNLANSINPPPRAFNDFGWMVDKTDQRFYISISDGRPPAAMPAWKEELSPTQRIEIINYIRAFTYNYPANIQKLIAEQPPQT
ncbi:MAG TPA: c-type cytochrome [Armatimonadota bacterium]|nr:c-type cytochrome [Armatimonadota bacterium]